MVTLFEEKKKRQHALEIEKQRQLNNIMRRRQNDPPSLNKCDPRKQWCYETVEYIVLNGMNDYFHKVMKKSYDVKNSNFNQLDFPVNHMLFTSSQYKIIEKFNVKDEFERFKM